MKKNKQFFKSGIHVLEIHIEASAWVCIFLVADQLVSKQTTDNNWTNTLLSNLNAPRKSTDLVEKKAWKNTIVQRTKYQNVVNCFFFVLSLIVFSAGLASIHTFFFPPHIQSIQYYSNHFPARIHFLTVFFSEIEL